jgi:hypothetical protein
MSGRDGERTPPTSTALSAARARWIVHGGGGISVCMPGRSQRSFAPPFVSGGDNSAIVAAAAANTARPERHNAKVATYSVG